MSERCCSASAFKYVLIIANVLAFVGGLILLIGGLTFYYQNESLNLNSVEARTIYILIIVCGCIILLLATLGLYSTIKNIYKCLLAYALFLAFLLLLQFGTGLTGIFYANSNELESYITKTLYYVFSFNTTNALERDKYQDLFKCCGWTSFRDYFNEQAQRLEAPLSCCLDAFKYTNKCKANDIIGLVFHQQPCKPYFIFSIRTILSILAFIMVSFSALLLSNIIFSLMMALNIRKQQKQDAKITTKEATTTTNTTAALQQQQF